MSAETKKNFEDALEAHIADVTKGSLTTGYFVVAQTMNHTMVEDNSNGFYLDMPDTQSVALSLGLIEYSKTIIQGNLNRREAIDPE